MAAPMLLLLLSAALRAPSAARAPDAKANTAPTVQVTVGVLLPERNLIYPWAWPRVAPALSLALEALQPQLRLDGISVRTAFAFASTEDQEGWCDAITTLLKAGELKCSHDPDVLLGMTGLGPGLPASFVQYWRLPLLRAGRYWRDASNTEEVYTGPLGPRLAVFQRRLFRHFNWTTRAVRVVSRDWTFWKREWCELDSEELAVSFRSRGSGEKLGEAVRKIKAKNRVVFLCMSPEELHQFMHLAQAQNMTNGDYVFFYIDSYGESLRAVGHVEARKPWQSQGARDTRGLQEAFQTVLVITPHEPQTPEYWHFKNQIILHAQRDFGVAINDSLGHLVPGCYHDVLLLYLRALNETLREGGNKRDTSRILEKMRNNLTFQGVTGTVSINRNNYREMDLDLWAMRDVETGEFQVVAHYIALEERINWTGDILWKKGGPPLDNLPCVFDMGDPSCGAPVLFYGGFLHTRGERGM